MFVKWVLGFSARRRAEKIAQETCLRMFPDDPVMGAAVCADEPTRYVVRVFCGVRDDPVVRMLPPWKHCFIFSVSKNDNAVQKIDDGRYRPILR